MNNYVSPFQRITTTSNTLGLGTRGLFGHDVLNLPVWRCWRILLGALLYWHAIMLRGRVCKGMFYVYKWNSVLRPYVIWFLWAIEWADFDHQGWTLMKILHAKSTSNVAASCWGELEHYQSSDLVSKQSHVLIPVNLHAMPMFSLPRSSSPFMCSCLILILLDVVWRCWEKVCTPIPASLRSHIIPKKIYKHSSWFRWSFPHNRFPAMHVHFLWACYKKILAKLAACRQASCVPCPCSAPCDCCASCGSFNGCRCFATLGLCFRHFFSVGDPQIGEPTGDNHNWW